MPIRPEWLPYYGPEWDQFSLQRKIEAGWKCEGSPQFPDCRAEHGQLHPFTGAKVVLTTAHLSHDTDYPKEPPTRETTAVWCQRCHCVYDAAFRARTRAATRRAALNNGDLFPTPHAPKESS